MYIYLPLFALIEMTSIWFRPGTIHRIYLTKRSQIGTSRNRFVPGWNAIFHPDVGNLAVMATGFLLSFLVVRQLKASCLYLLKSASGTGLVGVRLSIALSIVWCPVSVKYPKFIHFISWLKKADFLTTGWGGVGAFPESRWRWDCAGCQRVYIGTTCALNWLNRAALFLSVDAIRVDPLFLRE